MKRRWIRYALGGVVLLVGLGVVVRPTSTYICIYTSEDAARNELRSTAREITIWDILHPDEPNGWEAALPPRVVILDRGLEGWPVTLGHEGFEGYTCVVQNPAAEVYVSVLCGSKEQL
jgi:hypothetical protein